MKLRPSRYKALTWHTKRHYSPAGALVGMWTIGIALGIYFADDIILADSGEASPYPVLISIVGSHLSTLSKNLQFSEFQKKSSSYIHQFYEAHQTIGDRHPPQPWISNEQFGISEPSDLDEPLVCEDDRPPEPQLPTQILLLGSSSMYSSMGVSLEKQLGSIEDLHVIRHAKPGTGLSRPDVYNWLEISTQLATEHKVDLVVAQFIGNDCQSLVTLDKNIEAHRKDDHWNEAYRNRVAAFIDAHQARGAEVVMIGMPIVRSRKFQRSLLNANQIVKEVASEKGAHFISTWEKTADKAGRYTEALRLSNKTIKLRHDDGIHLSYKGAQYLAAYLVEQLKARYPWDKDQKPPVSTQAKPPKTPTQAHSNKPSADTGAVTILESSVEE